MRQNKSILIGLTGGIGTGKSLVSKYLLEKGLKVIDLDLIARKVVEKGEPGYYAILEFFGTEIIDKFENIDRKKLGEIVFGDENMLRKLNSITHPLINSEMKNQISRYQELEEKIIFCDIPLLFEGNLESYFDEIWVVYAERETQIKRVMERDKISLNQAILRIDSQMDIEEKKEAGDRVIYNTGTEEETYSQVYQLIKSFL
jgi:dephospho-CoA kinase